MFASRAIKPKLSISIIPVSQSATTTTTTVTAKRPLLTLAVNSPATPVAMMAPLRSPMTPVPMAPLRSPMSPLPSSPTARNTKINARGFCAISQHPQQLPTYTYSYANSAAASRSILKKSSQSNTSRRRVAQLQFREDPVVYAISPIEEGDYYGASAKMSREERRWTVRSS